MRKQVPETPRRHGKSYDSWRCCTHWRVIGLDWLLWLYWGNSLCKISSQLGCDCWYRWAVCYCIPKLGSSRTTIMLHLDSLLLAYWSLEIQSCPNSPSFSPSYTSKWTTRSHCGQSCSQRAPSSWTSGYHPATSAEDSSRFDCPPTCTCLYCIKLG